MSERRSAARAGARAPPVLDEVVGRGEQLGERLGVDGRVAVHAGHELPRHPVDHRRALLDVQRGRCCGARASSARCSAAGSGGAPGVAAGAGRRRRHRPRRTAGTRLARGSGGPGIPRGRWPRWRRGPGPDAGRAAGSADASAEQDAGPAHGDATSTTAAGEQARPPAGRDGARNDHRGGGRVSWRFPAVAWASARPAPTSMAERLRRGGRCPTRSGYAARLVSCGSFSHRFCTESLAGRAGPRQSGRTSTTARTGSGP